MTEEPQQWHPGDYDNARHRYVTDIPNIYLTGVKASEGGDENTPKYIAPHHEQLLVVETRSFPFFMSALESDVAYRLTRHLERAFRHSDIEELKERAKKEEILLGLLQGQTLEYKIVTHKGGPLQTDKPRKVKSTTYFEIAAQFYEVVEKWPGKL